MFLDLPQAGCLPNQTTVRLAHPDASLRGLSVKT